MFRFRFRGSGINGDGRERRLWSPSPSPGSSSSSPCYSPRSVSVHLVSTYCPLAFGSRSLFCSFTLMTSTVLLILSVNLLFLYLIAHCFFVIFFFHFFFAFFFWLFYGFYFETGSELTNFQNNFPNAANGFVQFLNC